MRKLLASRRLGGVVQGSAENERALCSIVELQMVSYISMALKLILVSEFEADELNYAALPHADVDTNDFYKHIDPTLLEPHRMRHLLTWCSARALPEKVPGGNRDPNEALAVDAGKLISGNIFLVF